MPEGLVFATCGLGSGRGEEELVNNAIRGVVAKQQQSRGWVTVREPWAEKQMQLGLEQHLSHSCWSKEVQPCPAIPQGQSCVKALALYIMGIRGMWDHLCHPFSPNLSLLAGTHILPMWNPYISVAACHLQVTSLQGSPFIPFPLKWNKGIREAPVSLSTAPGM